MRLVPLGQTDGQRIITALEPAIAETSDAVHTYEKPLDHLYSNTFAQRLVRGAPRNPIHPALSFMTLPSSTEKNPHGPLRIGIGGPVGAGKTTLTAALCRAMRDDHDITVITNDIYTKEDAEFLMRVQALPSDRIIGVETGGCPHTAIRRGCLDQSCGCYRLAQQVHQPGSRHHRERW